MKISIYKDIENNYETLRNIWNKFSDNEVPNGLQFDTIINWWNNYSKVDNSKFGFNKLLYFVVVSNNNSISVLPLVKTVRYRKKFIKTNVLEFASQSFTGEVLGVVGNSLSVEQIKFVFKNIFRKIKCDYVLLSYLSLGSVICEAYPESTFIHSGKIIIPTDITYQEIRKKIYSKNLRHVLNKFNRRIAESNLPINSRMLTSKEEMYEFKEQIKRVSLSKLSDENMHSIYQNSEIGDKYFDDLISREKPYCCVYLLDNKLLSYNMGYVKNNVVFAIDAAYNREFSDAQKIGLGILTYDKVVEYFAEKANCVDMGFGFDNYKFRFSKKIELTYSTIIPNRTLKSKLMFSLSNKKLRENSNMINQIISKNKLQILNNND